MRVKSDVGATAPKPVATTKLVLPADPQKRFDALRKMFEAAAGKRAEVISEADFVGWRAGHMLVDASSPPQVIPKVLVGERRGNVLRVAALHDAKAERGGPDYYATMTAGKAKSILDGAQEMFRSGYAPTVSRNDVWFVEKGGVQHKIRKVGSCLLFKVTLAKVTAYGIFETVVRVPGAVTKNRKSGDTVISFER